MKTLGLFLTIAVLFCFNTAAFSELSVEDLEKIRQIVNEAEARLEKRISDVETHFTDQLQVHGQRITDLRARVDFQGNLIIALICSMIAFVSAPLAYIAYQFNKYRARQEVEMDVMKKRVEELEGRQIIRT